MLYDIIKFLNLEDIEDRIDKIEVRKDNGILSFIITLKSSDERCPVCGLNELVVHDYRIKKIKHSISTAANCYIHNKASRYKCKVSSGLRQQDNVQNQNPEYNHFPDQNCRTFQSCQELY